MNCYRCYLFPFRTFLNAPFVRTLVLLGLLAASGGTAFARADVVGTRQAIQHNLDDWGRTLMAAVEMKDDSNIETVVEDLSMPDIVAAWGGGPTLKGTKQITENFKQWVAEMSSLQRYGLSIEKLSLLDDSTAVGVVRYHIAYDTVDPMTGTVHHIVDQGRERDIWIASTAGWKTKRMQGMEDHFYRDGKPDTPASIDRRALLAWYNRDKNMARTLDADRYAEFLRATLRPDYIWLTTNGQKKTLSRKITEFKAFISTTKSLDRYDFHIDSFRMTGKNSAEVTATYGTAGTASNQDGSVHHFTTTERYRDTWQRTPLGWKGSKTVVLAQRILLDGKPINIEATGTPEKAVHIRAALERQYAAMNHAIKVKDLKAFSQPYAPDYTTREADGRTITREQELNGWKQTLQDIRVVRQSNAVIGKLDVKGSQAIARVYVQFIWMLIDRLGKFGPKGKTHVFTSEGREVDTWINAGSDWKLKHSEILPDGKETVDGKPVKTPSAPSKRGAVRHG